MKKADQKIVKQLRASYEKLKEALLNNPHQQLLDRYFEIDDPNNGMTDEEREKAKQEWLIESDQLLERVK